MQIGHSLRLLVPVRVHLHLLVYMITRTPLSVSLFKGTALHAGASIQGRQALLWRV